MIRRATALDVPAMLAVLDWGHARSIYAGKVEIVKVEAFRLLTNLIQRHGGKGVTGTWVTVAVTDGEITGFIVGALSAIYHVGDRCTASDIFWITTDKASPLDSARLMLGMISWGRLHPKVSEIVCGSTGAMGDWEKAGGMLERMGLTKWGSMYREEVSRAREG